MLLRPGGIPAEALEACLGQALPTAADPLDAPTAPGQLASHYAPGAALRLGATTRRAGEVWIGFGPQAGADLNLSPTGDLVEAAANLFHLLREADAVAGDGRRYFRRAHPRERAGPGDQRPTATGGGTKGLSTPRSARQRQRIDPQGL